MPASLHSSKVPSNLRYIDRYTNAPSVFVNSQSVFEVRGDEYYDNFSGVKAIKNTGTPTLDNLGILKMMDGGDFERNAPNNRGGVMETDTGYLSNQQIIDPLGFRYAGKSGYIFSGKVNFNEIGKYTFIGSMVDRINIIRQENAPDYITFDYGGGIYLISPQYIPAYGGRLNLATGEITLIINDGTNGGWGFRCAASETHSIYFQSFAGFFSGPSYNYIGGYGGFERQVSSFNPSLRGGYVDGEVVYLILDDGVIRRYEMYNNPGSIYNYAHQRTLTGMEWRLKHDGEYLYCMKNFGVGGNKVLYTLNKNNLFEFPRNYLALDVKTGRGNNYLWDGELYICGTNKIYKYSVPDGTLLDTINLGFDPQTVRKDGDYLQINSSTRTYLYHLPTGNTLIDSSKMFLSTGLRNLIFLNQEGPMFFGRYIGKFSAGGILDVDKAKLDAYVDKEKFFVPDVPEQITGKIEATTAERIRYSAGGEFIYPCGYEGWKFEAADAITVASGTYKSLSFWFKPTDNTAGTVLDFGSFSLNMSSAYVLSTLGGSGVVKHQSGTPSPTTWTLVLLIFDEISDDLIIGGTNASIADLTVYDEKQSLELFYNIYRTSSFLNLL